MRYILTMAILGSVLLIGTACDSANTQAPTLPQASKTVEPKSSATTSSQPAIQSQSAPCVTATPLTSTAAKPITASAGLPERTTPGAAQLPPSPAELATREAQLEGHNRPVTLPTGSIITPSLPVCPTATPIK